MGVGYLLGDIQNRDCCTNDPRNEKNLQILLIYIIKELVSASR